MGKQSDFKLIQKWVKLRIWLNSLKHAIDEEVDSNLGCLFKNMQNAKFKQDKDI